MTRPVPPVDATGLAIWARRRKAAGGVLAVTAAFCGVLAVLLVWNEFRRQAIAPLDSPALTALKRQLADNPRDVSLREEIRRLDRALRAEYFVCQSRAIRGGQLLAVAAAVLLIALHQYRRYAPLPPDPQRGPVAEARLRAAAGQTRIAVSLFAVAMVTFAWVSGGWALAVGGLPFAAASTTTSLPNDTATGGAIVPGAAPTATIAPIAPETYAANWPRFRGPSGGGRAATGAHLPPVWPAGGSPTLRWKSPLKLPGASSPIVWDEQIFLTGADEYTRELYAFALQTGRALWTARADRIVHSPSAAPEVLAQTGFAAPSPATNGRQVFALFANGDLLACNLAGQRLWTRALGLPENHYGHAASLFTAGGRLLVPWDRVDAASLLALDPVTGATQWEAHRAVQVSWNTPIVIDSPAVAGGWVMTSAAPQAIAHRLSDGQAMWTAGPLKGESGASPVWDGHRVFVVGVDSALLALQPPTAKGQDGASEIAASPIPTLEPLWQASERLPDMVSPYADGERVWTLTSEGDFSCYRAADGVLLYVHEFGESFAASPVGAAGRLLLVAENGTLYLIGGGDRFELLAQAELQETIQASPALTASGLVIRGSAHLFCFDTGQEPEP